MVSLLDARIALGWKDAMTMPADFAVNLLNTRRRMTEPMTEPAAEKKGERRDRVETMPDGSKKVSFADIRDLSAALAAAGWSGVKIGGK